MNSPATPVINSEGLLKWYNEECFAKALASVIWSMVIYEFVVIAFVLISNLSLYYPLHWIFGSSSNLISLQLILSSIVVQALCCSSALLCYKFVTGQKKIFSKQGEIVSHLLESKQLLKILANIIVSMMLTFILKKFSYNDISDDGHLFLFLLSIFTGVYHSIHTEVHQSHIVTFPIINQKRVHKMKKMVKTTLRESIYGSLKILQFYYILFVLAVCIPRSVVNFLSNPSFASASSLISYLYALCNVQLFWLSFCLTIATLFIFKLTFNMLNIYLTEHVQFPFTGENCLSKAICSENFLLKVQAIYDLQQLSKVHGPRRSQMYMLTQPGSQAHTWNTISLEGVRLMDAIKSTLQQEIDHKQHNFTTSQLGADVNTVGNQNILFSDNSIRLRNVKSPSDQSTQKRNEKSDNTIQPSNNQIFNNIPVLFLYIEGLCNLIVASLKEDRYGVVQIKLPDILSSMFDLLETCETFAKVSLSPAHHFMTMGGQHSQQYLQLVSSLKIALKSGLYTMTSSFGHHLSAVRLSKEHQKRLHGFIEMVD